MRLKSRSAAQINNKLLFSSSTHTAFNKTCRCRTLILALSVLTSISVITSLLTVGHLHCRSPLTSGRRRGVVTGQRQLRAAGRNQVEYQEEEDDQTGPSLLCLFTTFKPVNFKLQIYENTLRNWVSLAESNRIRAILYVTPYRRPNGTTHSYDTAADRSNGTESVADFETTNRTLLALARQLGWYVVDAPRVNQNGLPYFKEMFADAARRMTNCSFYGYSNADILFTGGLVRTLESVREVIETLGRTLVIGRRTNSPAANNWSALYRPGDVERHAQLNGNLFIANAQDYFFIAGNRFPWHRVPDVVIGRPAYDNFIVATAINDGVAVVDATASLLAVHQSDRDGNYAGHQNSDRNTNVAIIGNPFIYRRGTTARSQFITKVSKSSSSSSADDDESGTMTSMPKVTVHYRFIRRQVYPPFWNYIGLRCR